MYTLFYVCPPVWQQRKLCEMYRALPSDSGTTIHPESPAISPMAEAEEDQKFLTTAPVPNVFVCRTPLPFPQLYLFPIVSSLKPAGEHILLTDTCTECIIFPFHIALHAQCRYLQRHVKSKGVPAPEMVESYNTCF